jgi:hydrogenase maturation protease
MRSLVLGLGNELIADDGIGILAARNLKPQIHKEAALLDLLVGYDRAIIIDAIYSGNHPPGTITQLNMDDLSRVVAPTPHFAGLPELFALAQRLELDFPEELVIFAVEAEDPLTIGGSLSPAVEQALPDLIDQTINRVSQWKEKHTS